MKTYNKDNFFKHTYCEFSLDDIDFFNNNGIHYKSKKGSYYHYTKEGVFRYSNHWGRVANCRWKIEKSDMYKNQKYLVGFAKWEDFYPLNDVEKSFYISVDNVLKKAVIHHVENKKSDHFYLFSLSEVQKRRKQMNHILSTEKWAKYFTLPID